MKTTNLDSLLQYYRKQITGEVELQQIEEQIQKDEDNYYLEILEGIKFVDSIVKKDKKNSTIEDFLKMNKSLVRQRLFTPD